MRQISSLGGMSRTQPSRQRPRHQRRPDRNDNVDGTSIGAAACDVASCYCDDLTESIHNPPHRPHRRHGNNDSNNGNSARLAERTAARRETSARAAKTTPTSRTSVSSAAGGGAAHQGRTVHHRQPRLHRTHGARPTTTGAGEHHGHTGEDGVGDGDGGTEDISGSSSRARSARLVATAPASMVGAEPATEAAEPRYSAARIAGEMSARAYPGRRNDHGGKSRPLREHSSSLSFGKEGASTVRTGGPQSNGTVSGRAGPRHRQRRRPGGGGGGGSGDGERERCRGSLSDVSVSSCGDMTISSEEQEGEEMAYTG